MAYDQQDNISIQRMFARIAPRYDLANDLLSFGMHRYWRNQALSHLTVPTNGKLLDACTGTGDLVFATVKRNPHISSVIGLDVVPEMLSQARKRLFRFKKTGDNKNLDISFVEADATQMPFADNTFDCISMGFGIRNIANPLTCLNECFRVLNNSGQLMILEFGKPKHTAMLSFYRAYSQYVMPIAGGLLTGDFSAYRYLDRTSANFPSGENFLELMREAGFSNCKHILFFSGIAHAYFGRKIGL